MFDKNNRHHQIMALHRYYIWTTLMKRDFESALLKGDWMTSSNESVLLFPIKYISGEVGTYMSYWYGGLYVVAEGWIEIGLSDYRVDPLIEHQNISLLKRYRNGAFHFQKDYFDARFLDFETEKSSVEWVRSLSLALGTWFLEYMREHKNQITADATTSHLEE